MELAELVARYEKDKPILKSWGTFVTRYVCKEVEVQLGGRKARRNFFKVPPTARVKDTDSLVGKAYWRGYKWDDPYNQINDKVGTRFVVLLLSEIDRVKEIIVKSPFWTYEKSRDFEQEAKDDPTIFSYQSVHFIVRANKSLPPSGIMIPEGTACEIQVRTLLQHAYSEMSHDNIYKSLVKSSVDVHRTMARCMGLIDSTDQMFRDASMKIEQTKAGFEKIMGEYEQLYHDTVHLPARRDDRTSTFLLEELQSVVSAITPDQVRPFPGRTPRHWGKDSEPLVYQLLVRASTGIALVLRHQ